GNVELIKQLSDLHLENQMASKNEEMMDSASRFVETAFGIFSVKNGLFPNTSKSGPEGGNKDDTDNEPDKEIR
ncbi:MAG: hypothetical protein ACYDG2_25900, partial [Ruminiclostridium sp.]